MNALPTALFRLKNSEVDYQNSPKGSNVSKCLSIGLSSSVSSLSVILSLKSLLSVVKIEKSSNDGE